VACALLAIDLAGVSLAGASPGQPIGGLDVTLVKCHGCLCRCHHVSVPDSSKPDEFDVRFFSWSTRPAELVTDPNDTSQAAGILMWNDFGVMSVSVVPEASTGLTGPAPGFGASLPNPSTTAAFEALEPAGPGRSWHGFSIPISLVPGPARVDLIFRVKALGGSSATELEQALAAGRIGVATADGTGAIFDPSQTLILTPESSGAKRMPALSDAGLACLALLVLAVGTLVLRRRRRVEAL